MEIINGPHDTPALPDFVPRLGGGKVLLWSLDPPELLEAYMEAIGNPPKQPVVEGEGFVQVTPAAMDERGRITSWTATYNPSGHDLNQDKIAKWQNEFSVWKAQCEPILAIVNALIEKGKAQKPKQ